MGDRLLLCVNFNFRSLNDMLFFYKFCIIISSALKQLKIQESCLKLHVCTWFPEVNISNTVVLSGRDNLDFPLVKKLVISSTTWENNI